MDAVTSVLRNALGEPLQVSRGVGATVSYSRTTKYDSLGRILEQVEPNTSKNGVGWRYAWDDANRLVGTSDARGCGKNVAYDALNRILTEDYSPCLASQPAYSAPTGTAAGVEVQYVYDVYEPGQVAPDSSYPDEPQAATGRLVAVRDRGATTRLSYDARGQVRRVSRRMAKPDAATASGADVVPADGAYDAHWFSQRTDYDLADRPTAKTTGADLPYFFVNGQSAETFQYSSRGLLAGIGGSHGTLIQNLEYWPDGLVKRIEYGDLATTTARYFYDSERRLTSYEIKRIPAPLWGTNSASYPSPNGAFTTPTVLADVAIGYDGVGNPLTIEDFSPTAEYPDERAWPMRGRQMQYDDQYRTKQVDYGYGTMSGIADFRSPFAPEVSSGDTRPVPLQTQVAKRVKQQTFDYDALGNVTSTSDDASTTYDRSLGAVTHGSATSGPNQLRSSNGVTANYDDAGNLVELKIDRQGSCPSGGATSRCRQWFAYDWDEVGQLARARRWDFDTALPSLPPGAVPSQTPNWELSYAYSQGSRSRKTAKEPSTAAKHTLDVFSSMRLEGVTFDDANEVYPYQREHLELFLGGGMARVIYDETDSLPKPEGQNRLHTYLQFGDHLGSGTATIDLATSELVERTTYQAFGATESDYRPARWNASREPLKFTGKEEDIEVGLQYFGARYYQPHLGRWASADPLTIHGLGADLNPYAYVGGRVMNHVDPFGLQDQGIFGSASGGITVGPDGVQEVTVHGAPRVDPGYPAGPSAGPVDAPLALDRFGSSSHESSPQSQRLLGLPPDGATTDRAIGAKQDWSDPKFRQGQEAAAVVGAVVALVVALPEILAVAEETAGTAIVRWLAIRVAPAAATGGIQRGQSQAQGCSAGSGCSSPQTRAFAQSAMDKVRAGCPTGNCLNLSQRLKGEMQQGELLTAYPTGRGPLPTLAGVAPQTGWGHHVVVQLPGGEVLDPLRNIIFASTDAYLAGTYSAPVILKAGNP